VNVRVIPNGVDWPDELCGKREAKRAAGVDPGARLLLFAAHGGADAGYKAGDRWMELWRSAEKSVPGSVGVMAGGDKFSRKGNFLELPYLAEGRMRMFFRAADVFAYPTRADNHPLAVLEAMSEGAACLAFAAGGLPEQIEDGVTGFLVPEGDWAGYKRKLVELLSNPRRTREIGMNAFTAGREKFSSARMVSDYLNVYSRVCGEPATTS
jgi:glycosyltransferase involved in cell wall biosynthesis